MRTFGPETEPTLDDPERGAALVLALGVMLAVGVIVAALLSFVTTSLNVSTGLNTVRARQYAADGAVEQAIEQVRSSPTLKGIVGSSCPTSPFTNMLNGVLIQVDCQGDVTTALDVNQQPVLQRNAVFTACLYNNDPSTKCNAVSSKRALLTAKVNFQTNAAGAVTGVFVQSWSVST